MSETQSKPEKSLYPHFTDRARLVIKLAEEEAERRGAEAGVTDLAVGLVQLPSEEASLLLRLGPDSFVKDRGPGGGIGGLPGGLGGLLMRQQGVDADSVRAARPADDGNAALASVLQSASKLATELHHAYVGTEHLLLGVVSQSTGSDALRSHGLTDDFVRAEIIRCTPAIHPS